MIVIKFEGYFINDIKLFKLYKNCIKLKKKTALTLLLPVMFDWIVVKKNKGDGFWRWVYREYEIILIVQKLHSIEENNCFYLAFTNDDGLNWCKKEWYWWSPKVSTSKSCNNPNQTRITFNKKTAPTLLLPMVFDGIDVTTNEIDNISRLAHQNYVIILIIKTIHSIKNLSYLAVTGDVQWKQCNN